MEDWDRTQAVCLRGVFLGIKHSIKPMRAQGGGSIISTASIAGIDGYPNLHAYCAAKAGVVNVTRSASIEFAADKIRVNCVCPAPIDTPMLDIFMGRPDVEANKHENLARMMEYEWHTNADEDPFAKVWGLV